MAIVCRIFYVGCDKIKIVENDKIDCDAGFYNLLYIEVVLE